MKKNFEENSNPQFSEIEVKDLSACPFCGSKYTEAEDGHKYTFCPICGRQLRSKYINKN